MFGEKTLDDNTMPIDHGKESHDRARDEASMRKGVLTMAYVPLRCEDR